MIKRLSWRLYAFVGCILVLMIILRILQHYEANTCMGVRILSDNAYSNYTKKKESTDIQILLDGNPVAMDTATNTLYISQQVTKGTKYNEMQGTFMSADPQMSLFFAPDQAFQNLDTAVAKGHRFKLLAAVGNEYTEYRVVFTTLPIIKMDGKVTGVSEENRDIFTGAICIWDSCDPELGSRSVKTCNAQWKIRGASAAVVSKKSWKISLKDNQGNNEDLSFLGLGADDDWILNAMAYDDVKLREKMNGEIWNKMQEDSEIQLPMSEGEYAELILNNKYCGLYLLQRRVDEKYLGLDDTDVLMKGKPTWTPETVVDAYEIISDSSDEDKAYALAEPFFAGNAARDINLENWIDLDILLQLSYMVDNSGNKNMFYLWKQNQGEYEIFFIPWDTDMAYGYIWTDTFVYRPEVVWSIWGFGFHRNEYDALLEEYPDLHEKIAKRWWSLRKTLIHVETLTSMVNEYNERLDCSGALSREYKKWGYRYGGNDTLEELLHFLKVRIAVLDEYYS